MTRTCLHKYPYSAKQWLIGLRQAVTLIILQSYPYSAKQWLTSLHKYPYSAKQWLIGLRQAVTLVILHTYSAKQWLWSACQMPNMLVPTHRRKCLPVCLQIHRTLSENGTSLTGKKIAPREANSFFLELSKGRENHFYRVVSPEIISITLKYT